MQNTISFCKFLSYFIWKDISDDDEAKSKAKIADALGVDWTQLMTSKTSTDVGSAGSQVLSSDSFYPLPTEKPLQVIETLVDKFKFTKKCLATFSNEFILISDCKAPMKIALYYMNVSVV